MNYNSLEKQLEKSAEQVEHPKKGLKPKTWIKRGELLQKAFDIDLEYLTDGIDKVQFRLYYKDPLETLEETLEDGTKKETLKYERMDYIFENGRLSYWIRKKSMVEDPLNKAFDVYLKALDLDGEGKYISDIQENLTSLKNQFKRAGINAYFLEDSDEAMADFEMVNKINDLDMFSGVVDTTMIQYTGIMAREVGDYEKAIKYYKKLTELDFGGPATYFNIKSDYLQMEDTTGAISIMEAAFNKYPDSLNVIANLVDIYIKGNQIEQGLETINKSIEKFPERGELLYWKGRLLLNSDHEDKIDEALEVYDKAVKLNSDLFYVYYDIGLIKFLQGQDIFSQAGLEKDMKRREQINKIATEKYEEAIPNVQKALDMSGDNITIKSESLDILKRIYYKLYGPEDQRYKDVVSQIDNL